VGEEKGEDTGSYLEGERNLYSDIGGEGEGKIGGRCSNDFVT